MFNYEYNNLSHAFFLTNVDRIITKVFTKKAVVPRVELIYFEVTELVLSLLITKKASECLFKILFYFEYNLCLSVLLFPVKIHSWTI